MLDAYLFVLLYFVTMKHWSSSYKHRYTRRSTVHISITCCVMPDELCSRDAHRMNTQMEGGKGSIEMTTQMEGGKGSLRISSTKNASSNGYGGHLYGHLVMAISTVLPSVMLSSCPAGHAA